LTRLLNLDVSNVHLEGRDCLKMVCSSQNLFREAYLLYLAVIDRATRNEETATVALTEELKAIESLFGQHSVLSIEKQIGLFGELFVLSRLLDIHGSSAINAWTGPLSEPHDFRIGDLQLEVKTTSRRNRIHRIHGLMQTVPSPGCSLAIVSLTIGIAGSQAGHTLPELVSMLETKLGDNAKMQKQIYKLLGEVGYRDEDSGHYDRSWSLRQSARIVNVNTRFPSITPELLQTSLGTNMNRIEYVEYEVNMDGMGVEWEPSTENLPLPLVLKDNK